MISVTIIDDNKPITDRIVNTIPWDQLGCEVVSVDYDGISGKKAITRYLPQLIISDIKMPNLSGLEVIELTRTLIPNSRVIFISAYDEFDYAYRAIKLKAFDYLIKPFSQTELLKVIQRAVNEIHREEGSAEPPPKAPSDGAATGANAAQRAMDYMEQHLSEHITLETLAARFGLSATYLGRLIKQQTGQRFMELLMQLRMDKAKQLLCSGEYRVGEIGEMVGYKNYLTFYKVFSKLEGVSPTEYAHSTNP